DGRRRHERCSPRLRRHRDDTRTRTGALVTSTIAYESAIAAALASRLPTAAPTVAVASQASGDTGDAVVVSYVGEASAQLAVQILEADALIDGLADAPLVERLHDPLEAAVVALGAGRLDGATLGDASAVF